jgi:hypothetical protein
MRIQTKAILVVLAGLLIQFAQLNSPALAKERCGAPSPDKKKQMESLGISVICTPVSVKIKKDWLEFPTEVLTSGLPQGIIVWNPKAGTASFSVPKDKPNLTICSLTDDIINQMPTPGEYQKHGWEKVTDKSADYGWVLNRRPVGHGDTYLNVDLYFSMIPKDNLLEARNKNLCQQPQDLKRLNNIHWR